MKFKSQIILSILVVILINLLSSNFVSYGDQARDRSELLSHYIDERRTASKIPGLAVIVVQGEDIVYEKYSGYSNLENETPVTSKTLFEMGSNTKAFTGLAILQLINKGLLELEDPVSKYLPWFYMNEKGKKVDLTIKQLLYHTSAISPETIGDIPESNEDDALEKTVRMLVGQELRQVKKYEPGESFIYATINYDVLGLIIQQVTGESYENYLQNQVIRPLGLNSTFINHEDAVKSGLATGYKLNFLRPYAYDAPRYRGNIPAGYLYSTPLDMARWMQIQLGVVKPPEIDQSLIEFSHKKDTTVPPGMDGSSYAAGWFIYQSGSGEISHGGSNPNYSSYISMRLDGDIGVVVQANMNSEHTEAIARGVMSIMRERVPNEPLPDTYSKLDKVATAVVIFVSVVIPLILYLIVSIFVDIFKGRRRWKGMDIKQTARLCVVILMLALYLIALYKMPLILFEKLPWNAVYVWSPFTLIPAVIAAAVLGTIYTIYSLLLMLFQGDRQKMYVPLATLGIISGFGNAFIIFVINQSLGRDDNLTNGLLYYFVFGILLYVLGQRYISIKLVKLTNNLVYEKRMTLIKRILRMPYEYMERIEDGRLHAVLNNDTEQVSGSVNVVISGVISLVTLICCFIYLGMLNIYALIISIVVIAALVLLYFLMGQKAEKSWEETREIQTVFFHMINDLLKGFKELRLNQHKNDEFEVVMNRRSSAYRDKRTEGDVRFANVNVIGELLFTIVIGVVAFFFPIIFPNVLSSTVQAYVFVFLYMTGPVNGILNAYPQFLQIRIAWKRIRSLNDELSKHQVTSISQIEMFEGTISLNTRNVHYGYPGEGNNHFEVGPFDLSFQSGSITFITGGNGSGKTTLAKLLTGLYTPTKGEIIVNGKQVTSKELGSLFSAVFSDYYLFDRLYGIDCKGKETRISQLLQRFQLQDKVAIQDGCFTTTMLSTGQKKRLALLLLYLEDRPICLLDEWAADQDPEYRQYFYHEILPELKAMGKCVIAITHDDRYFNLADSLIKLERGEQVNI
ncbi:putative ATP-binding cassette transporter [Paenibacillus sp. CF095]|uniref:cyclic peptide export ABC transporter n=1 Tax=Paenibacillus sp. CF095 TaxID=1881033 RepID=UPI000881068F|nr:cyclic peptide export ABC transporter [Paenibacillus sp. CF095]SDD50623.1 putative ATP-binding cassette transporter [Paenibacillus sp. CF095]